MRDPNPYARTPARELYNHLTRARGWSHGRFVAYMEDLYDRRGPRFRFRLLIRCHNALVLRRRAARAAA